MADKITLENIDSLQNQISAKTKINSNFTLIANKIDTLLSLDGDTPNQMETNLDMNSYRITNVGAPVNPNDAVRLQDISGVDIAGPAVDSFTGTGSQTVFTLTEEPYLGNIKVFIDGIYQHQDTYSVTTNQLTFSEAPPSASKIEVFSNTEIGSSSSTHTHVSADITDLNETVEDIIGTKVQAGPNIAVTYSDSTGITTITGTGAGGSTASSTSFAPIGNIAATNVQAAIQELDTEKAPLSHTQFASTITDFQETVEDIIGSKVQAGPNITVAYSDTTGVTTITGTGGSSAFVTPEAFGAIGDGVTDDTSALQSALRSTSPCLLVGTYLVTGPVAFGTAYTPTGKLIMGQGKKHIILGATNAGLTWTSTTPDTAQNNQLVAKDFTIMVSVNSHARAALRLETTGGSGSTSKTFDLRNIHTFGTDGNKGALIGIQLVNQRNGIVDSCIHQGVRTQSAGARTGFGISCEGTGDPVDFRIVNCHAYFAQIGLNLDETHEGITVDKCVYVATDYGVYSELDENPVSGDNEGKPLLKVSNCHMNNTIGGVYAIRTRDFSIVYNDFLAETANSNWTAVLCTTGGAASQYGYISGNKMQDATTGSPSTNTTTGVRLNGVSSGGLFTIVGENRYISLKRGLLLESNARYVQYSTGSVYAGCTTNVIDNGSLNTSYGGGGGGGGVLTDAQLLNRTNHTGYEPHATGFAKGSGAEGGELRLQVPDSTSLNGDIAVDISTNSFRVFETGGSQRGAALDLASCGSSVSTSLVTNINLGNFMPLSGVSALGNFALLLQSSGYGAAGGTVSGSDLYYAATSGYGANVGVGTWRRHGETSAAGQVTLFQRVA